MQAGKYNATLIFPDDLSTMFTTSLKGNDGIKVNLAVDGGEHIEHTLWLTPNAYDKSVETLATVFGFDGDWRALAKGQPFPKTLCSITVEMEEFTTSRGDVKISPKVKWLNCRDGSADVQAVLQRLEKMGKSDPKPVSRNQGPDDWNGPSEADKNFDF